MKKSLYILSSILAVAVIVLGIFTFYFKQELNGARDIVSPLQEEIINLKLDNGTMEITIGVQDKEIDKLYETIAVDYLLEVSNKKQIENLAEYIEFMQELCDANGILYPYYVIR